MRSVPNQDASLVGSALRLGFGMAGAQGLIMMAMPLWSRQFAADDFARLGVWTAVTGVVSVAVSLRYEAILMLPERDADAFALYRFASRVVAVLGAVLSLAALAFWTLGPRPQLLHGLESLGAYGALAVFSGALSAWMGLGQAWLNRHQAYGAINRGRLCLAVATVVATSAAGSLAWAPGLWLGHGFGVLMGAVLTWLAVRSLGKTAGVSHAEPVAWRETARRYRDAPLYLWPSALMDTITQQLPFVLAVSWFGASAAGQFTLAWRSLAVPLFMVSGALGAVFYQRFARLSPLQSGQSMLARQLLLRVWTWGAALALLLSLVMAGFGETLFGWVFGASWRDAGALAAWLTPMVAAMAVSSATSGSLLVLGGQRFVPLFGLAMLCGRPLAFAWASQKGQFVLALQAWCCLELSLLFLYNALIWRRLRDR